MDMEGVELAADIETLISKLCLLEKASKNDTKINSTSEKSNAVVTITSIPPDTGIDHRNAETRDARIANSLLSLDEDIPEHIDESIKELLKAHSNRIDALGCMKVIVSEDYLAYKQRIAARKAVEKKLPRSKGGRFAQLQTSSTATNV